jgi:hypothetical protein
MNGMSIDPRNRRGLNSNDTTAMVVFVDPYMDGLHVAHAMGAFKLNNVMYAFNAWGEGYIEADQRTSRVLPDNARGARPSEVHLTHHGRSLVRNKQQRAERRYTTVFTKWKY